MKRKQVSNSSRRYQRLAARRALKHAAAPGCYLWSDGACKNLLLLLLMLLLLLAVVLRSRVVALASTVATRSRVAALASTVATRSR